MAQGPRSWTTRWSMMTASTTRMSPICCRGWRCSIIPASRPSAALATPLPHGPAPTTGTGITPPPTIAARRQAHRSIPISESSPAQQPPPRRGRWPDTSPMAASCSRAASGSFGKRPYPQPMAPAIRPQPQAMRIGWRRPSRTICLALPMVPMPRCRISTSLCLNQDRTARKSRSPRPTGTR